MGDSWDILLDMLTVFFNIASKQTGLLLVIELNRSIVFYD